MNSPMFNRSAQRYARIALLVCVIGWALPGCGGSAPAPTISGGADAVTPQPGPGATTNPGNTTEDPAMPAAKPATLAEVRQAIDWFQFPKPDGAKWEKTDLLTTHYWVPGTNAQAADFYRKALAAKGWVERKKPNPDTEPDKHQFLEFSKAGFLVGVSLSGKNEYVEVNLSHLGNVDARRLPKPADAKVAQAYSGYVSYTSASKPETAAEFCRKEIAALGWREMPVLGAKNYEKAGKTVVRLVQNAMQCEVTIARNKEGETEVVYTAFFRGAFDPAEVAATFAAKDIPRPAGETEALQTLDLRKLPRLGESTPKINTGLRTEYETRATVAAAVAFYRKALTEQGWALAPPLVDEDATGEIHFEKAGYLMNLKVNNLINLPNKAGLVKITLTNHGNVDLRQLPYLPDGEIGYARQPHTQYRASATSETAAAFYRKELAGLGWQEKGKKPDRVGDKTYSLEFFQNGARLRVIIDTTRDGQTPIQLLTALGGEG